MNLGSILPVGTIIHSMLTTTQFASEYGDNWVLADGRSVSGTKYALVTGLGSIPDMRGAFLRAKGATYNPDGDLAIGAYSSDKLGSHVHTEITNSAGSAGAITGFTWMTAQVGSGTHSTTATGSNETSPRSITVNVFIRIN